MRRNPAVKKNFYPTDLSISKLPGNRFKNLLKWNYFHVHITFKKCNTFGKLVNEAHDLISGISKEMKRSSLHPAPFEKMQVFQIFAETIEFMESKPIERFQNCFEQVPGLHKTLRTRGVYSRYH